MRIALIADTFPPLRSSGAVQLRDLSREFIRQRHALTVFLPDAELTHPWSIEKFEGAQVLRLRAPRTKDIGYIQRTLGEFLMPFSMRRNYQKSPLADQKWDGVVWYSPSIFHGPFAKLLKDSCGCKGYLIIRDIFPEWAADMGLMGRGIPYYFFKAIANYQYQVADTIGVQTPGNLTYFSDWSKNPVKGLEVLQNWLGPAVNKRCSIRIEKTPLAKRKVFVYAGNMGVAQGMDILLDLAKSMSTSVDIGFLFVGRGSEAKRLANKANALDLKNVVFRDEIEPDEIPDLYSQCHAGLVALDPRHESHNIPGKFLTYMQSGLPVLANVNHGNDLAEIIRKENVGRVCEDNDLNTLKRLAAELLKELGKDDGLSGRCRSLFQNQFSVAHAVSNIVAGLTK
jgi:glycosyltransferase involved in cell wall biosynthesis